MQLQNLLWPPVPTQVQELFFSTCQAKNWTFHEILIKIMEALIQVNPSIAIWLFLSPQAPDSELLNKPSSLGQSITQISTYFDSFCLKKELTPLYVSIFLGFNADFDIFMENARVMLSDFPAWLYKRALQVARITTIGWLFTSHKDLSLPSLEEYLSFAMIIANPSILECPIDLKYKPIWDGTSKSKQQAGSTSTWVIHVDAATDRASFTCSVLKRLFNPWQWKPTLTFLLCWSPSLPTKLQQEIVKIYNALLLVTSPL